MLRVRPELLPPFAAAFLDWIEGQIALQASPPDLPTALARLSHACHDMLGRVPALPALWPSLAACSCDLALALARSGQTEAARRTLRPVWPVARHHVEPARLAQLRQLLDTRADTRANTPTPPSGSSPSG